MKNIIDAWMEVETADCDGNITGCFEVLVRGYVEWACKGSRDHYGQQLEPDTDSTVTFLEALLEDGSEYTLDQEDEKRAQAALQSALENFDYSND